MEEKGQIKNVSWVSWNKKGQVKNVSCLVVHGIHSFVYNERNNYRSKIDITHIGRMRFHENIIEGDLNIKTLRRLDLGKFLINENQYKYLISINL